MLRHSAQFRIIENELQTAHSFLDLAGLEAADQNSQHAGELVAEAEHSLDVITELLSALPTEFLSDQVRLSIESEALKKRIQEIRIKADARTHD